MWTFNFEDDSDEERMLESNTDSIGAASGDHYWNTRDFILFAIDCSQSMFPANVTVALECCRSVLENKIISSERDMVGVLLFNTRESQNASGFSNIFLLHDIQEPDVSIILTLDQIIQDASAFTKMYGSVSSCKFSELFWTVSTIFSNAKIPKHGASKRLFLITNQDNPNGDSTKLQEAAKVRVQDMLDGGIKLELFNLSPTTGTPFNLSLFYGNLLEDKEDLDFDDKNISGLEKFDTLKSRILRKEVKKRPLSKLSFILGPELEISVKIYILYAEARKSVHSLMDKHNREVQIVRDYICKDTGASIMPIDLNFYYEYGGAKAIFTKDEMIELKKFGESSLQLLGFKPKSRLKPHHNIKHSYFIYPDEDGVKGSSSLFSDLLERMWEQDKIAICRYIARSFSVPRLVALLPQREKLDGHGIQVKAPGFHVIVLPFADDLRDFVRPEKVPDTSEEQVEKVMEIIDKLKIDNFQDLQLENPVLKRHFSTLQAHALGRDFDFQDPSLPNVSDIDVSIKEVAKDFIKLTGLKSVAPTKISSNSGKRDMSLTASSKRKNEKVSEDDQDANVTNDEIILKAYEEEKLNRLTVNQLKEFLSSRKIKAKRLKGDLLEQVTAEISKSN